MINKIKIKIRIKNKNEILALCFLIIVTIFFTTYYNHTKKKINDSYNEVIHNDFFKKTANHFLDNLEPKFKKIRHQIQVGETFDNILNQYLVNTKEIQSLKNKLSEKINLNKLKGFTAAFLILFIFSPFAYAYVSVTETDKRTDYPGKEMANNIEIEWNKNFKNKIKFVIGKE